MTADYRYYIYLHKHGISGKPFIINETDNDDFLEMTLISDIHFNFYGKIGEGYLFKIYRVPFKGSTHETTAYLMENRKKLNSFLKFIFDIQFAPENDGYIVADYAGFSVTFYEYKKIDDIYYLSHPSIKINKSLLN
jgi:hypothetical protein